MVVLSDSDASDGDEAPVPVAKPRAARAVTKKMVVADSESDAESDDYASEVSFLGCAALHPASALAQSGVRRVTRTGLARGWSREVACWETQAVSVRRAPIRGRSLRVQWCQPAPPLESQGNVKKGDAVSLLV